MFVGAIEWVKSFEHTILVHRFLCVYSVFLFHLYSMKRCIHDVQSFWFDRNGSVQDGFNSMPSSKQSEVVVWITTEPLSHKFEILTHTLHKLRLTLLICEDRMALAELNQEPATQDNQNEKTHTHREERSNVSNGQPNVIEREFCV